MNILVAFVVGLLIFLVFRELFTWYWKQTRIVSLLEQIEKNTRGPEAAKAEPAVERAGAFTDKTI